MAAFHIFDKSFIDRYQDLHIHEFMCMYYPFIILIMTYSPFKKFSRLQRVNCISKALQMWKTSLPFLDNWLLRRLSCVLDSSLNVFGKCVLIGVHSIQCAAEPLIKMLLSPSLDLTDLDVVIPI